MEAVYIEDLKHQLGQEVTLRGWLYNRRSSGKVHFLLIRDGTGLCQCVASKADLGDEAFAAADHLGQESSLEVTGTARADERAPGGIELTLKSFKLIAAANDYPITPKEHGVAFLLDLRHLWIRSARQHAVLRIRSEVEAACRDFFHQRGFVLFDAPMLTPTSCEGTTNLFELDYFGERKAYLTQSGQLYAEAGALAFGKVYCFGPTFRAEKSKTRRHLTEFWMVEPEVAFFTLDEDMQLAEDFVSSIVARVLETRREELKILERDVAPLEKAAATPYPRITYDEALARLKTKGFEVRWGEDLGGDEETALSAEFDRPVLVHRYPAECKAFYMKRDPARPEVALCVDMLAPEGYGEIIGGGQREDDYETLKGRLIEHNLPLEAFSWYLDLRRYGSVPHAGFGMGIERAVSWICGIHHVREAIPFPRMMERIEP
ncbi:MAG TPA: asparagine--tRNA ligase [Candidatus Binataceae bacterium]|nr:asparagine--tRNA ligase [Candidatus Binataceae bacterium]HVB81683.1 asparagine--tRNA ligase [Candidatus Binataceae bacterium]